jgi:hypothetical protein
MRWIDNGVVDMVSTVHTGREMIVKKRRKPQETSSNYQHRVDITSCTVV